MKHGKREERASYDDPKAEYEVGGPNRSAGFTGCRSAYPTSAKDKEYVHGRV
jgi:hypothetical protein